MEELAQDTDVLSYIWPAAQPISIHQAQPILSQTTTDDGLRKGVVLTG